MVTLLLQAGSSFQLGDENIYFILTVPKSKRTIQTNLFGLCGDSYDSNSFFGLDQRVQSKRVKRVAIIKLKQVLYTLIQHTLISRSFTSLWLLLGFFTCFAKNKSNAETSIQMAKRINTSGQ